MDFHPHEWLQKNFPTIVVTHQQRSHILNSEVNNHLGKPVLDKSYPNDNLTVSLLNYVHIKIRNLGIKQCSTSHYATQLVSMV